MLGKVLKHLDESAGRCFLFSQHQFWEKGLFLMLYAAHRKRKVGYFIVSKCVSVCQPSYNSNPGCTQLLCASGVPYMIDVCITELLGAEKVSFEIKNRKRVCLEP